MSPDAGRDPDARDDLPPDAGGEEGAGGVGGVGGPADAAGATDAADGTAEAGDAAGEQDGDPGGGAGPPSEGSAPAEARPATTAAAAGGGRVGSATARMAAAVLVLEAFLILFATLVAQTLPGLSVAAAWTAGGTLALVSVLLSGLVRRRSGLVAGSVFQVVIVATGFWVPTMFLLGGLFAGLWIWLLRLGTRIDRDRARLAAGP